MSLSSQKIISLISDYPFTMQSGVLKTIGKTDVENIARKGENAGNQHFLLFPLCFLPYQRNIAFKLLSAKMFSLDESNILMSCKVSSS